MGSCNPPGACSATWAKRKRCLFSHNGNKEIGGHAQKNYCWPKNSVFGPKKGHFGQSVPKMSLPQDMEDLWSNWVRSVWTKKWGFHRCSIKKGIISGQKCSFSAYFNFFSDMVQFFVTIMAGHPVGNIAIISTLNFEPWSTKLSGAIWATKKITHIDKGPRTGWNYGETAVFRLCRKAENGPKICCFISPKKHGK